MQAGAPQVGIRRRAIRAIPGPPREEERAWRREARRGETGERGQPRDTRERAERHACSGKALVGAVGRSVRGNRCCGAGLSILRRDGRTRRVRLVRGEGQDVSS
jgi:hypothetical protein